MFSQSLGAPLQLHSTLTASLHTAVLTHLEYDAPAVHFSGDGVLLIRAGLLLSVKHCVRLYDGNDVTKTD